MFRSTASESDVDRYVKDAESHGGEIGQRYNADFLRGFAARLPDAYVTDLQKAVESGKETSMYVRVLTSESIERDQEMHV